MDLPNTVHTPDGPHARTVRRPRLIKALGAVLLSLAAVLDLTATADPGPTLLPQLVVLPAGLAAVLWPVARRPVWLTPAVRTAVPAVLSGTLSAVLLAADRNTAYGFGEAAVLLCLLVIAVRDCPPRWASACGVLAGAAVVALPYRDAAGSSDLSSVNPFLELVLTGVAVGVGGYLRTQDQRRRASVLEIRRAERLAMAADLHDFVAHHVTGILVQTQVAQLLVTTEPERLTGTLKDIEHAAVEALASMRRTVGLLREASESGTADRRPRGDLAELPDLVAGFGGPVGPDVELRRAPSVPDGLPHEVQAAAYRVVQEALTNVRRHAADATEVTVDLDHDGRTLEVTVRDDGRGGTRLPQAARGGGFGLVGLTERVTALGGELRTGPRRDQRGWEVSALLPAPEGAATAR
ncbi:histidine kinase [Streptomyces sp. RG80]|uniref:sensor histidine kinase n=1 Tax=Streptomyces sp. RG80 TaxID=3157340 RepID=UPI00338FB9A1